MTLEELGLKYETTHVDLTKNTQKEEWYLKINRESLLCPAGFFSWACFMVCSC